MHTTVREANDRGYRCIVPGDCCGSYFPEFHEMGLRMIKAQGGIFGWVTDSARVLARACAAEGLRRLLVRGGRMAGRRGLETDYVHRTRQPEHASRDFVASA